MDFDLDILNTTTLSEKGSDLAVKLPDGTTARNANGEPVVITLRGLDSEGYRAAMRKSQVEIAAEPKVDVPTEDDIAGAEKRAIQRRANVLAACTIRWTGILDKAGEPIAPSFENAAELYLKFPLIANQVDMFVGNRANFLLAKPKG